MANSLRFFTTALRSIERWLKPPSGYKAWLYPGVPLALCIGILTSVGPSLQQYALSALNSSAPSLYGAAYDDQIVEWPNLGRWIFHWNNLIYLTMGAFATIPALRRSTIREIGTSVGGWVALLLTFLDATFGLIQGSFSATSFGTNAIANIIGGSITGLIVFIALSSARLIANLNGVRRYIAPSAVIISAGFGVNALCYYVFFHLYQPLPVSSEALLKAPVGGWFLTENPSETSTSHEQETGDTSLFSLIPSSISPDKIEIISPQNPLSISIPPRADNYYQIEVRFFTDCLMKRPAQLPSGPPTFVASGSKAFKLTSSGGFLYADGTGPLDFASSKSGNTIAMFSLSPGSKGNSSTMTRFDGSSNTVSIGVTDITRLALGVPSFEGRAAKRKPVRRVFKLMSGLTNHSFYFEPPTQHPDNSQQQCKIARPVDIPSSEVLETRHIIKSNGAGITAVIKVKALPSSSSLFDSPYSKLEIAGVSGWTTVHGLPEVDSPMKVGSLRAISFQGTVTDFTVDTNPHPARPYDSFVLQGQLEGEYLQNGTLRIHGKTNQLWRNGRRLNPTKWEMLSTEWQLSILGAFGAFLIALWRLLWPAALKNANETMG